MYKHKLLHISSRDRQSGSPGDFRLSLDYHKWLQEAKAIVVKSVAIPNIFYNVNETNNTFTYNIAGSPSTVTVAQGQYNVDQLISALSIVMAADGVVGFTGVLDLITKKIGFSSTTPIEYLGPSSGNAMGGLLGITEDTGADLASFTAQGLPDMSGVRHVLIISSALGENNYLGSDQKVSDVICVVPINKPFGEVIQYETPHAELDDYEMGSKKLGKNISTVDIKIGDPDTDRLLDLTNHEVDIVLKVYY